jgi:hypothetical protein
MPRFAWPAYEESWEGTVEAVRVDEIDASQSIDHDHLRVDLYDREWEAVELTIMATTNEPPPNGLDDVQAHVLLSCPATQLRRPYPIEFTTDEGRPTFRGSINLPRSAVARKAFAVVEVIATHDGRRRVIGSTLPWAVIIEKADAPEKPGVPPLRTVWVDFAGSDAPEEARRHAVAHAYVDVRAAPPVLYLNKAIDGLQSLILADRPKLERRRQRDLISAYVARYVASTLFRSAVEEVSADEFGGPAQGPTGRVFRDICEAIAAELPETETVQDLYDVIARLPDGPPDSAAFWSDVDLALDRITSVSSTVATVVEQVKHV